MVQEYAILVISIFGDILSIAIIARVIMSWIRVDWSNKIARIVMDVTDPIMQIAKKITPRTGMLDLSPIIALIGLDVIKYLLIAIISAL